MLGVIITVVIAGIIALVLKKFLTNPGSDVPNYTAKTTTSPKPQADAGGGSDPLILYGTQTGTAEMFSKTLQREGNRQGIKFRCEDTEEYPTEAMLAEEKLVIFVMATYGEGEPTDSSKEFYDYIRDKSRYKGEFSGLKYSVFGLGDRQYTKFCQMGYDIDERMAELGAERIYDLGTGDAGKSLEEEWDSWRQDLWPAVATALNIKLKVSGDEPVPPELNLMMLKDVKPAPFAFPRMSLGLEPTHRQPAFVKVLESKELLNGADGRSTRHIAFDISDTSLTYQAGDHLGVLSCNPDDLVGDYLKALGIDAEQAGTVCALVDKRKKNTFPARVTVREALKWYVDLSGVPKKSALRAFAHYCEDPKEKAEFQALLVVGKESQEKYHTFIHKVRNVLGVVRYFKSCKIPLGHFLELMPHIAPRYFSIASDQLRQPGQLCVTVALVEGGLCTTMLAQAAVGQEQPVFVRKSTFHLPMRAKTRPLIMIGPGTGVAPLIGFVHRRAAWQSRKQEIGKCLFFFGCRRKSEDYIYQDLLESAVTDGIITDLHVAFSRDQKEKKYVQHDIKANAVELWELLSEGGANMYLCGDAKKMAKDVEFTLKHDIIMAVGKKTEKEADAFIDKMLKEERYLKDVWSA